MKFGKGLFFLLSIVSLTQLLAQAPVPTLSSSVSSPTTATSIPVTVNFDQEVQDFNLTGFQARFFGSVGVPNVNTPAWTHTTTNKITTQSQNVLGVQKTVVKFQDDINNGLVSAQIPLDSSNWSDINAYGATFSGTFRMETGPGGEGGFFTGLQDDAVDKRYGVLHEIVNGKVRIRVVDGGSFSVTLDGLGGRPNISQGDWYAFEVRVPVGLGNADVLVNGVHLGQISFYTNNGGSGSKVIISSGSTGSSNRTFYVENYGVDIPDNAIPDIQVTNGSVNSNSFTQVSASQYTFEVNVVSPGTISVDIPAGICTDLATSSISNTASNTLTIEFDNVAPSVNAAIYSSSSSKLVLLLSEVIDITSIDLTKLSVHEFGSLDQISLENATVNTSADSNSISITLDATTNTEIAALTTPLLDQSSSAFSDLVGNNSNQVVDIGFTIDNNPPVLTLLGDNIVTLEATTPYTDAGATAFDDEEGDITGDITVSGTVDTSTIGTYILTYNVSDVSGNNATALTRTINVTVFEHIYENGWVNRAPSLSDSQNNVLIKTNATIGANFGCAVLTINSGAILTIPDGMFMEVDELVLDGDLYLEGDAELIQTEVTNTNTGSGLLYKIIDDATSSGYRYSFLSSPVHTSGSYRLSANLKFNTGLTLGDNTNPTFISTDSDGFGTTLSSVWFYILSGPATYTKINETRPLFPGIGFTMKGTNQANDFNFIGSPNNGNIIPLYLATNDYALVGNPYPSAIDGDVFNTAMLNNNTTNGTIYFWDQPTGESHLQDQYNGGYATRAGGVGAAAPGVTSASVPTNVIKPGQGFVVVGGTAGGNITFTNSMRISNTSSSGATFFRTGKFTTVQPVIRLGFEFESEQGTYHRQLVTTPNGGTLGYDLGRDAKMLDDFDNDAYWLLDNTDERYVISSVPQVSDDLTLNLGVSLESEKEITFTLDDTTSYSGALYLWDHEAAQMTNIRDQDYTTSVASGDHTDRFSLVFKSDSSLESKYIHQNNQISVYVKEGQLYVDSKDTAGLIEVVKLYDLAGREIMHYNNPLNTTSINVPITGVETKILIAKVISTAGVFTKKIYVKE